MTFKDGLNLHSDKILHIMDEIMPSGSRLTDLSDDIMKSLRLIDDDQNETFIPASQQMVTRVSWKLRRNVFDNQVGKISYPAGSVSEVTDES